MMPLMPEKSLNELRANVRELYDKGVAALQKNNLDYAIELFMQVLRSEPACYDAREALRATQHRRSATRSKGLFSRVWGATNTMTKGRLALRSDPIEAIQIAEEALNDDPSNAAAHQLLADGALAAGFPKTAILSLEVAFKFNPSDRKLAEKLADATTQIGQRARAEKILRDLLATDPTDPGLNEKLKNLLASRTLAEGGYEALADGSGSYRDILKDKDQSVRLEQEQRTVKDVDVVQRLLQDAETRLASDPDNLRLLRDIADLHLKHNNPDRAIQTYQRILEVSGIQDPTILKLIRDARLAAIDLRVQELDPAAPDHPARLADIESERQAFRIDDARQRAESNPTDLMVRFDLGELYLKAGRVSEAIAELQKSQNNPNRRIASMVLLAQCFSRRNMNDLAARKLQEALKEKVVFDDEKKEIHYQLGLMLEKMGRPNEAIEQFKIVYEADIGFRDVATKIDAYYASQP